MDCMLAKCIASSFSNTIVVEIERRASSSNCVRRRDVHLDGATSFPLVRYLAISGSGNAGTSLVDGVPWQGTCSAGLYRSAFACYDAFVDPVPHKQSLVICLRNLCEAQLVQLSCEDSERWQEMDISPSP